MMHLNDYLPVAALLSVLFLLAGCASGGPTRPQIEEGADEAFLEQKAQEDGVTVTESGLMYEVIDPGSGPRPGAASEVTIHYHGTLIDESVFDSSVLRGQPARIQLNEIDMEGLIEGIMLMRLDAHYMLYIPGDLAYGDNPPFDWVHKGAAFIYEIQLIQID